MRKIVEWVVDHPRMVIGFVILITIGFAIFLPQLTMETDFKEYLSKENPAVKAMERAEDRYGSQTFFMVAIKAEDTIFKTSTLEKIKKMRREFEEIIGVEKVTGPLNAQVIIGKEKSLVVSSASPKGDAPTTEEAMQKYRERVAGNRMVENRFVASGGKAAAISIELKKDADQVGVAKKVIDVVEEYRGPEKIFISGLPYMNLVLSQSMGRDLRIMLPLVVLVIVTVLYLSFWSLRGVLLPLLVVSLSTVWTVGAMAITHVPFTIISFILPVILMAIGIAYCIHVLNKYYEEISDDKSKKEAVIETAMMMASPVSMAGLTTAAGFLSLISSFLIPQRQFGIFTAFGVVVAMLLALIFILALLSILKLPQRKMEIRKGPLGKVLSGFDWLVTRHRKLVLGLATVIFIACILGTLMVRVETSQKEFLGEDHPVVQGTEVMDEHFSGSEQVVIEIDTGRQDGLKDPAVLKKMVELEQWLKSKSGVQINKTVSLTNLVREMNQTFHADDPNFYRIPDTQQKVAELLFLFTFGGGDLGNMALGNFSAGELIGYYNSVGSSKLVKLKTEIQNYLDENFSDLGVEMVGGTRLGGTLFNKIVTSQITSLVTAILAAGLIVALLMRSLVAGLISLIPLVMTVVVNFGVMGFSNTPLDMATLMISSIAIGIGIDYAIHFISRFREEYRQGQDTEQALSSTIHTTGRGITYNAVALTLGFAVLLFSTFKGTANFGLLISMTMVVSAVSAFTIIPAILLTLEPKFLTKRAWSRKDFLSGQAAAESQSTQPNTTSQTQEVDKNEKS